MKKIQEQQINSPRGAVDPIPKRFSPDMMKTMSTEGREGIYTSTKGRNGGTRNG